MAKLSTEYVNEWPVMGPLGKKESVLLAQNLSTDEEVLGTAIGSFGQTVVATTKKVIILKSGFMSGQTFGNKATSFDYRTLVGVEVRQGFAQGEFEILAGGLGNNQASTIGAKVNMAQQPNGLVFPKTDAKAFNAMATKIRDMSHSAHSEGQGQAGQGLSAEHPSVAAIKQLSELHDAGILSDSEFETKKKDLLSKM